MRDDGAYVLGYSDAEHRRLQAQARLLQPWTEHFFRSGGLSEGMTVLDLGSGTGDVSIAAADIEPDLTEAHPSWPACQVWDDSHVIA
jgi:ribosomal protein L11 methylase PrmA